MRSSYFICYTEVFFAGLMSSLSFMLLGFSVQSKLRKLRELWDLITFLKLVRLSLDSMDLGLAY